MQGVWLGCNSSYRMVQSSSRILMKKLSLFVMLAGSFVGVAKVFSVVAACLLVGTLMSPSKHLFQSSSCSVKHASAYTGLPLSDAFCMACIGVFGVSFWVPCCLPFRGDFATSFDSALFITWLAVLRIWKLQHLGLCWPLCCGHHCGGRAANRCSGL